MGYSLSPHVMQDLLTCVAGCLDGVVPCFARRGSSAPCTTGCRSVASSRGGRADGGDQEVGVHIEHLVAALSGSMYVLISRIDSNAHPLVQFSRPTSRLYCPSLDPSRSNYMSHGFGPPFSFVSTHIEHY